MAKKPSARHLMPKKIPHATGYSDGKREHHSDFQHHGVSEHDGGPEWSHGKGDDMHMSHPGMPFTSTNPDKAANMTGIHHRGGRLGSIHSMLTRR